MSKLKVEPEIRVSYACDTIARGVNKLIEILSETKNRKEAEKLMAVIRKQIGAIDLPDDIWDQVPFKWEDD